MQICRNGLDPSTLKLFCSHAVLLVLLKGAAIAWAMPAGKIVDTVAKPAA